MAPFNDNLLQFTCLYLRKWLPEGICLLAAGEETLCSTSEVPLGMPLFAVVVDKIR